MNGHEISDVEFASYGLPPFSTEKYYELNGPDGEPTHMRGWRELQSRKKAASRKARAAARGKNPK